MIVIGMPIKMEPHPMARGMPMNPEGFSGSEQRATIATPAGHRSQSYRHRILSGMVDVHYVRTFNQKTWSVWYRHIKRTVIGPVDDSNDSRPTSSRDRRITASRKQGDHSNKTACPHRRQHTGGSAFKATFPPSACRVGCPITSLVNLAVIGVR